MQLHLMKAEFVVSIFHRANLRLGYQGDSLIRGRDEMERIPPNFILQSKYENQLFSHLQKHRLKMEGIV